MLGNVLWIQSMRQACASARVATRRGHAPPATARGTRALRPRTTLPLTLRKIDSQTGVIAPDPLLRGPP